MRSSHLWNLRHGIGNSHTISSDAICHEWIWYTRILKEIFYNFFCSALLNHIVTEATFARRATAGFVTCCSTSLAHTEIICRHTKILTTERLKQRFVEPLRRFRALIRVYHGFSVMIQVVGFLTENLLRRSNYTIVDTFVIILVQLLREIRRIFSFTSDWFLQCCVVCFLRKHLLSKVIIINTLSFVLQGLICAASKATRQQIFIRVAYLDEWVFSPFFVEKSCLINGVRLFLHTYFHFVALVNTVSLTTKFTRATFFKITLILFRWFYLTVMSRNHVH